MTDSSCFENQILFISLLTLSLTAHQYNQIHVQCIHMSYYKTILTWLTNNKTDNKNWKKTSQFGNEMALQSNVL